MSSSPPLPSFSIGRLIRILSNGTISLAWARVLWVVVIRGILLGNNDDEAWSNEVCETVWTPTIRTALLWSWWEVLNALVGLTRSKPAQVGLFSFARTVVEFCIAPRLSSCTHSAHLLTVAFWSLGDTIRFGCFFWDEVAGPNGGRGAKYVRYTVGPLLFPFGAGGEMVMVVLAAYDGRPFLWTIASLWPIGFYPLMKQLLKQRSRFLASNKDEQDDGKPKIKMI